jgi:hypothetical protein
MVAPLVSKPPRDDAEPSPICFRDLMTELEARRTTGLITALEWSTISYRSLRRADDVETKRLKG